MGIKTKRPVVINMGLKLLRNLCHREFDAVTIDATFSAGPSPGTLEAEVVKLCADAETTVDGEAFIILSDHGVTADSAPMPRLLALLTVHSAPCRCREAPRRRSGSRIGRVKGGHTFRAPNQLQYQRDQPVNSAGRSAIHGGLRENADERRHNGGQLPPRCGQGLLKIMSKMNIATVGSYRGFRLFSAVDIDRGVASEYFGDTTSAVCDIGLDDIAAEYLAMHSVARFVDRGELADKDDYAFRRDGKRHCWNSKSVKALQTAVGQDDRDDYDRFVRMGDGSRFFPRDLLDVAEGMPVPLNEVEPTKSIMRRF